MKGILLFLALYLVPLGFTSAVADDASDIARAATRRGTTNTVQNTRKKTETPAAKNTHSDNTVSRSTNITPQANNSPRERNVGNRSGTITTNASRGTTDTKKQSVTARSTSVPAAPRPTASRTSISNIAPATVRSAARVATMRTAQRKPTAVSNGIARSATNTDSQTSARERVMSAKYSDCRTVYYDCMDEFCANKDTLLKRCACSSRTNEFNGVKKQLDNAEEKLLDFSERLLAVNLDAEDATAMYQATEGELAFQKTDTTTSKKMLDEIAKKLNTKIDSTTFEQNLSPISLSLNEDAAWDSVNSFQGASTTTKSGTDLYAAALPVCREMALEICTQDELDIIESGYQMAIEQDCNTVAKSYVSQTDSAREKIRESSALLDMARLDIYQKRNSDDILTCKTKMLDMLSDTSVCGNNLSKCLDTTGQYIDPSTGEAFLTTNLVNLANLITRPSGNQTWTNAPGNAKFVSYLNTKKQYLEPAMENCQDIADYVWNNFIEDALAQIKLAQDAKLEEVRQSCTTLTTQCLSETAKSLAEFDARALSTFGVAADKTVNAMCADVKNACSALLQGTGGGDEDWVGGMTEIATDTTYETLMQTCREVGRACIIQACTSISGNFGLCENVDTSINRKAIINRTSCWKEVLSCVQSAGQESIDNIIELLAERNDGLLTDNGKIDDKNFYKMIYGPVTDISSPSVQDSSCEKKQLNYNCVYDICYSTCNNAPTSFECRSCRIAEQIWGNCEVAPATNLSTTDKDQEGNALLYHNRIRKPIGTDATSLLYWFAVNTGTEMRDDSCRDTTCGPGFMSYETDDGTIVCKPSTSYDDIGQYCPNIDNAYEPIDGISVCCNLGTDDFGNCCGATAAKINYQETKICYMKDTGNHYALTFEQGNDTKHLICFDGEIKSGKITSGDDAIICEGGDWLIVSSGTGHYETAYDYTSKPSEPSNYTSKLTIKETYNTRVELDADTYCQGTNKLDNSGKCTAIRTYKWNGTGWDFYDSDNSTDTEYCLKPPGNCPSSGNVINWSVAIKESDD